jgi:hypothetical protein
MRSRNQNQQQNGPPWAAGAKKDREEEEGVATALASRNAHAPTL